jgi:hypothetical protein
MAVSFIGGRNLSSRRKPLMCRKSLKQRIAREAREEVRNPPSFRMTSQTVIAVNALGSVKEKPPLPPK